MSYYINYYKTIFKNLNSNRIFYRYFKKKKNYKDSLIISKKILNFLVKNNYKKKQLLLFLINHLKCTPRFFQF